VTYYTLRLCASRGAYEAIPENPRTLDLAVVKARLQASGIPVIDARVMLIAQMECEVTFGRDGRVLIKSQNPGQAERLFASLKSLLEPDGAPRPGPTPAPLKG
jgi:hypothetical protein